jgi:hypothetical protein
MPKKYVKTYSPQFEDCFICGLAMIEDDSSHIRPRSYTKVKGAPFCHACRDMFEAKVWVAANAVL